MRDHFCWVWSLYIVTCRRHSMSVGPFKWTPSLGLPRHWPHPRCFSITAWNLTHTVYLMCSIGFCFFGVQQVSSKGITSYHYLVWGRKKLSGNAKTTSTMTTEVSLSQVSLTQVRVAESQLGRCSSEPIGLHSYYYDWSVLVRWCSQLEVLIKVYTCYIVTWIICR